MFARDRSFVSCKAALSPSKTFSLCSDARIEATAGLQISQPSPWPCAASTSSKLLKFCSSNLILATSSGRE